MIGVKNKLITNPAQNPNFVFFEIRPSITAAANQVNQKYKFISLFKRTY